MKDYYKILGVSDAAEIEVITAAYRALMRKYRPDTNPGPSSAEKAKEINEAYEVLCDAGRRRNYDQQRQAGEGGQSQEQERARQERERERKEQTERQKREQDAQAREEKERERQERIKREREQQEREAHAKKMASSGGKSDNKAAPVITAKSFYRSQLLLLGFPVVAGLVIIGLTSTDQSLSVQSAAKINDGSYDRRASYAFETKDFSVLRDLANKGHSSAQFYLGLAYDKGDGVREDDVVAADWYQRAAQQGDMKAQYNLGVMYTTGQGVPQYYAAAVEWFRKAAEQGDVMAQYRLGLLYVNGTGVDRDYVQAHKWLNLAAAGAKDVEIRAKATKSRDFLAAKMSPAGIAEAQRLAGAWQSRKVTIDEPKSLRSVAEKKTVMAATLGRQVEQSVPKPKPALRVPEPKAAPTVPTVSRTGSSSGPTNLATPLGSYNRFIADDYPIDSRIGNEEGVTRVSYVVGVNGQVSQCEVVQTSGFQRLDDATCAIIQRRFRFNPATLNGQPVPERKTQPIRWSLTGERTASGAAATASGKAATAGGTSTDKGIGYVNATPRGLGNVFVNDDYPSESRRAGEEGVTRTAYVVGVDGRADQCEIVQSSGFKRLDDATCSIITRRFRYNPATLNGQPVPERRYQPMRWRLLTPVAAVTGPFSCKATPAQIRTLAAAKGGEDAAKVIQLVATGEKLCAEASKPEAGKKFARAAELLGTDLAALSTTSKKQN